MAGCGNWMRRLVRAGVGVVLALVLTGCARHWDTTHLKDNPVDQGFAERGDEADFRARIRANLITELEGITTTLAMQARLVELGGNCTDAPGGASDCLFTTVLESYYPVLGGFWDRDVAIYQTVARVRAGEVGPEVTVFQHGRTIRVP